MFQSFFLSQTFSCYDSCFSDFSQTFNWNHLDPSVSQWGCGIPYNVCEGKCEWRVSDRALSELLKSLILEKYRLTCSKETRSQQTWSHLYLPKSSLYQHPCNNIAKGLWHFLDKRFIQFLASFQKETGKSPTKWTWLSRSSYPLCEVSRPFVSLPPPSDYLHLGCVSSTLCHHSRALWEERATGCQRCFYFTFY